MPHGPGEDLAGDALQGVGQGWGEGGDDIGSEVYLLEQAGC